jgi:hypothetical protein
VADSSAGPFSSRQRRELFLQLAATPGGVTAADVYAKARELGDTATEEAYYNIARRLVHRAVLVAQSRRGEPTRYMLGREGGDQWLQEDELAEIIDPEYPLLAITVWREAVQQINDVPEAVWAELRERLSGEPAPELFSRALLSYADDFAAQISDLAGHPEQEGGEYVRMRKEAEACRQLIARLAKRGLGLSEEAIHVPASVDLAIKEYQGGRAARIDEALLREEVARRVEPVSFVTEAASPAEAREPLVGAVDGSTRGGLLSLAGEDGDFNVAHAPLVNINTAVGQINRALEARGRLINLFVRLPERPEDMQRQENRHTVMAKLLHPDLTDAQYMHAVWNAMDLVEIRTTLRLLKRWYGNEVPAEIPPADVVLRDGTVTPQDRDFTHYKEQDSYGQIVRDIIEASWEVALRCREDDRTVCGVVKATQLWFYGPVLNWFACQLASSAASQIKAWPMETMNIAPDQLLITRLLTAKRGKGDVWSRTCVVLRPFHAVTNFAEHYRRAKPSADSILEHHQEVLGGAAVGDEDRLFWSTFQGPADPFVKMLREAQYGSFFLAAVPRLDNSNMLPRFELFVPARTAENETAPWPVATRHVQRLLAAIQAVGWDVAAEHTMFLEELKLDVLPRLLIKAHDTVKIWAAELLGRVQEYVGYQLARYTKTKRMRGIQVRPFTRAELEALYAELRKERERQAGARRLIEPDK